MWTSEIPTDTGWYLWRFCPQGEPPVIGALLIYEIPGLHNLRVQEFAKWREGGGVWEYSEWAWRVSEMSKEYTVYPTEFLRIGAADTNADFVRAFRDLYETVRRIWVDLNWKPNFDTEDFTHFTMAANAMNTIHKEIE